MSSFGARTKRERNGGSGGGMRKGEDVRCERNVLREPRISHKSVFGIIPPLPLPPSLTSICAFYGPNFLKDVQTTKLNAQLDVKERPPLNIYRRACARFFLHVVSPEREPLTERRVECEMVLSRIYLHCRAQRAFVKLCIKKHDSVSTPSTYIKLMTALCD